MVRKTCRTIYLRASVQASSQEQKIRHIVAVRNIMYYTTKSLEFPNLRKVQPPGRTTIAFRPARGHLSAGFQLISLRRYIIYISPLAHDRRVCVLCTIQLQYYTRHMM